MERKPITCPVSAHLEEIDARMDRHLASDRRERVLLLYADDDAHRLADQLAALLGRDDLEVELADAEPRGAPPPQDYDAVVVVARVHRRRLARSSADYVSSHRDALTEIPSFFVPISTRSDDDLPAGEAVAAVSSRTGWAPRYAEAIAMHTRPSARLDKHIRALATKIADEIPRVDSGTR